MFNILWVLFVNEFNINILPNNDSSTYDGLETPDFFDILEMCDLFDTYDCGYTLLS